MSQRHYPKILTNQPGPSRTYTYQWSFMGPHPSEDVFGFTLFPWRHLIHNDFSDSRWHPKMPLIDAKNHIRSDTFWFHVSSPKSEESGEVPRFLQNLVIPVVSYLPEHIRKYAWLHKILLVPINTS